MVRKWRLTLKYKDGHSNTISKRFKTEQDAKNHFERNYELRTNLLGALVTK